MKRAVFLDRDGVINKLAYNSATSEYESPHKIEDLHFCSGAFSALKKLQRMHYLLFLVSNQPSYAKKKTSLHALGQIHKEFHTQLKAQGIVFTRYYYCYHHQQGLVKRYAYACACRKPRPFFLLKAKKRYGLDMGRSWFIGDSDSDVECGKAAGVKTIAVEEKRSAQKRGKIKPDFSARDLRNAVNIISEVERKGLQ